MIPISFERERIQNLPLYFVQNTKYVSTTKLCKLLYFLDMEVYVQTGFSVTNLQYRAKSRGPVPDVYFSEIELQSLQTICERFHDSLGTATSEESHLESSPWKDTWKGGDGDGVLIDFNLEEKLHYNTEEIERRKRVQDMSAQQSRLIASL